MRTARNEAEAAARAERVAALRREEARRRLAEAERLLEAARRRAETPGDTVRKAREAAAG